MNINDAFPSQYLKAADLQGRRVTATISEVLYETLNDEKKPIVYFVGKRAGLVLNKTNATAIIEITGSAETNDWVGQKITLYPTKVPFQGKSVDAIRVEAPAGQPRAINLTKPRKSAPAPEPPVDEAPVDEGWADERDDDIPF